MSIVLGGVADMSVVLTGVVDVGVTLAGVVDGFVAHVVTIESGMPIGLLLALTYTV